MNSVEKTNNEMVKGRSTHVGEKEGEASAPKNFRFSASAFSWGLAAGLGMAAYLLLLHVSIADDSIFLKFVKHLILIGVLGWGLWKYRMVDRGKYFFRRAMLLGASMTFYAALTLALVSLIIGIAAPDFGFDKFNMPLDSSKDVIVTTGALFIEVLVFGLMGTFIWLQYLKSRGKTDASNT